MCLTVRAKPIEGEALSSYLLRLAESNGLELLTLWNLVKKRSTHFIQMNDLNVLNFFPYNTVDINKLSELSDISVEELLQCTFLYLLSKFNKKEDLARSRFLSGMLRDEFYYCPLCIKQKPHYKLIWNINGVYTCEIHKTSLQNHCVHCNQIIKIKDIKVIGICPNCGGRLTDEKSIKEGKIEDAMQPWLYEFWTALLKKSNFSIASSELAVKLLFILNDFKSPLDRERVSNIIGDKMKFAVLLQHARESLSQERVLHISFVTDILYKCNLNAKEFMELKVPIEFTESLRSIKPKKSHEATCLAPWCNKYNNKGALVKTATSYKMRKDGSELLYYLVCPECSCEYAYNSEDRLIERTNLIQVYEKLSIINNEEMCQKELAKQCGLTVDRLKRCLAYFYSRRMFINHSKLNFDIDNNIVEKIIYSIKSGEGIKKIQNWDIWQSYQHFLIYRYHNDVIRQLYDVFVPREERLDKQKVRHEVECELKYMLDNDIDISIASVSKRLNVCPETLRLWGCYEITKGIKFQQIIKRKDNLLERINKQVISYFEEHYEEVIKASNLYKVLGIKRNILWRTDPELTSRIHEILNNHNKRVNKALKTN